jgi:tRNA(fMet)-specific endonuclease VapC
VALGLVVVDTDVLIDFLRGRGGGAQLVAQLISERRLRTTAITAFELRLGTDFVKRRDDIVGLLRSRTLAFDTKAAMHAGAVHSVLKLSGASIGYRDTLIAGTCLRFGLPLATRNTAHFDRVDGLDLEPLPHGS